MRQRNGSERGGEGVRAERPRRKKGRKGSRVQEREREGAGERSRRNGKGGIEQGRGRVSRLGFFLSSGPSTIVVKRGVLFLLYPGIPRYNLSST